MQTIFSQFTDQYFHVQEQQKSVPVPKIKYCLLKNSLHSTDVATEGHVEVNKFQCFLIPSYFRPITVCQIDYRSLGLCKFGVYVSSEWKVLEVKASQTFSNTTYAEIHKKPGVKKTVKYG